MPRRLVVLASTAGLGFSLLVGGATLALFTDTATNSANTFQSGTLKVALDKQDEGKVKNAYFTIHNMQPGDSQIEPITISSTGSLGLKYTMKLSVAGVLGTGAHPLTIAAYPTEKDAENGTNQIDLTQPRGMDASDGARHQEILCVKVTMPEAAGNEYQGESGTATISVYAEQLGTGQPGPNLHSASGTDYDSNGHVISVSQYLVGSDGHTYFITKSNPDRAFEYDNIPDGTYTITTKDPMYPIDNPQSVTVNGNDVTGLIVHYGNPTYTATFNVRQNGAPFVGNVYLRDSSHTFTWGPYTSNNGTYTVPYIAPGTWEIYSGPDSQHLTELGTAQVTTANEGSNIVVGQ